MISHVLDTCAVLDLAAGRWRRPAAQAALDRAAYPVVLSLSVWEIARKLRLRKLELRCEQNGVLDFVQDLCGRYDLHVVPVGPEICQEAELLPPPHEDPLDRMIIAAARLARAPIFTTDPKFARYFVEVLPQR